MEAFYPQCLLSCLILIISDCRADPPSIVLAYQEENVTVPCVDENVMDPKSSYRVRWMKYSTGTGDNEVVMAWSHESQHAELVKLNADGGKQMSLLLTNVQKSDEGLYSCEMCEGWNCELVRNISLRVKDCKVLSAINAAASAPIKLDFPVAVTSRPQNISWVLLKGGEPVPLPSDRVRVNHTSLVIQPMKAGESVWYRCNYIHRQTKRCFDIKINVQDIAVEVTMIPVAHQVLTITELPLENRPEESGGTVIAVVSSVVIGIVVAAAVIGVLIYCCRNTQRVLQRTQRSPAAGTLPHCDAYETVSLSDDPSNSQVNSIYQQVEDETLYTFHY